MFKQVIGYEGRYVVSDSGTVKSLSFNKTGVEKEMTLQIDRYGYYRVGLCGVGKQKYTLVHRLVAEAFISNPNFLPCVNHIDGNKLNNSVLNLEWCTFEKNSTLAAKDNLYMKGERHGRSLLTEKEAFEIKYNSKGISQHNLAKIYGVGRSTISSILYGKNWKHI
jgi:hypothetical protein